MRPLALLLVVILGLDGNTPALSAQDRGGVTAFQRQLAVRILDQVQNALDGLYYDSTFGGKNLDRFRYEAQRTIDTASTRPALFGAVAQYVLNLGDSHTRFFPPGLTVSVDYGWTWRMIGENCYVSEVRHGSDAERQGLAVGDQILAIGGVRPTRENISLLGYVSHLLRPTRSQRLYVAGYDGERRWVEFESKIERLPSLMNYENLEHLRYLRDQAALGGRVEHQFETRDSVAIWRFNQFGFRDRRLDDYMRRARDYPWLIVDLRGNPGGAIEALTRLLGHFFDEEFSAYTEIRRDSTIEHMVEPRGEPYQGQVVILVDSRSASSSELFSRVLQQHGKAMVVGDKTAGAVQVALGLGQRIQASNRTFYYGMQITVFDVVMADGDRLEGKGVIPNVAALPTGRDLAEGRDPAMQFALELAGVKVSSEEAGQIWH